MGNLVETGLGWYLDEDYLLTLGNQTLGTVGGGSPTYPQPSSAAPYTGPFSNLPVQSPGFALNYYAPGSWWTATWQSSNIGTAMCWEFCVENTIYVVTNVQGTTTSYYGGSSGGTTVIRTPLSGYPGFYYASGTTTQYAANFTFSSLAEAMAQIESTGSSTVTKVQGGAGSFAFVSYPKNGATVHVGVGISSIPNPNSAATVAVNGVNGSYTTFNREGIEFTMYYTGELPGMLTNNVPIVAIQDELDPSSPLYAVRLFLAVANASQIHASPIPADVDPYAGGGTSTSGGGDGTFDNTSDAIIDSGSPTFSFAGSGFCRIYNPTLSQLQSLANYLWTDTTFLQTVVNHAKQLLEDPIEAIISLAMLPVAVPQGSSESVRVLFINTGVSMAPATTQYVEVDCGSYALEEYYGSALDYNPYTQVDLFLPFIGQVSLNTDEVMGHTISVKYRVDIVSGMCVAKIFVDGNCLYQFSGNCAIFMPLNSADFSSYLSAAITAATALVSAGAGAAAGSAAAGAEAIAEPAVQTGGNLLGAGESLVTPQMAAQYRADEFVRSFMPSDSSGSVPSASLGEMERKFISNTALAVLGSKISFEHASHLAGNSGILGIRRPYLIINRPDMCNPAQYGKYNGRPCMMYLNLGSLSGYTEVQEIQLTGFSATNPELAEISKMLKGGVIL